MPDAQRKRPDMSSENEKGEVRCRHIPSCTKWVHRSTRNKHWRSLLHNGAQGKCMRCVRRVSTAHSWFSFLSVVDAGDADDEASSSETEELESSVDLSNGRFSSETSVIEISDEYVPAVRRRILMCSPAVPAVRPRSSIPMRIWMMAYLNDLLLLHKCL